MYPSVFSKVLWFIAADYATAGQQYISQLKQLDADIQTAVAAIPTTNRKLVTDHEVFGYFATRYGFTIVGAVIPSLSTLAAPSAQELAMLEEQIKQEGVKAISATVAPITPFLLTMHTYIAKTLLATGMTYFVVAELFLRVHLHTPFVWRQKCVREPAFLQFTLSCGATNTVLTRKFHSKIIFMFSKLGHKS